MKFQFLGLICLITTVLAVFSDEAYVTDWKIRQIGPLDSSNILYPRKEILNLLTKTNTLAGIQDGNVRWRVHFDDVVEDSKQSVIQLGDNIVTGLNYLNRSLLQVWDPIDGFWIKDLAIFTSKEISAIKAHGENVIVVFKNGEVVLVNNDGDIKSFESISKFDNVIISPLENGNFIILFNEQDTENTHYGFYDGEKFHTHTLQISWSSIKEFHGAKLVYQTIKYYVLQFDKNTGVVSSPIPIQGKFDEFIAIRIDSLIAFERNHNIEILKLDGSLLFTIPNVHKYLLKFVENSFILFTEYHVNIIDPDTGDEISSFFLGDEKLPFDLIKSISVSTDGVENIHSMFEFSNQTYSYVWNNVKVWQRDASLSQVVAHAIVDLEVETSLTPDDLLHEEELNVFQAYLFRLTKHAKELKQLYESFWETLPLIATGEVSLFGQTKENNEYFGFIKYLILGTKSGRVIALNTLNGEKVWSFDTQQDDILSIETVENERLYVFTKSGPRLELDAKTGEFIEKKLIVPPLKVEKLDSDDKFYVEIENEFAVILSDDPSNLNSSSSSFIIKHDSNKIQGLKIEGKKVLQTWKFETTADEEIVAFASKDEDEKIANVGYVLGDRSVLYKYLYPNFAAFAVLNKPTKTLYIHIIDSITGEIVHTAYHDEHVHEDEHINILFGEHWVIYSYWSNKPYPEQKIVVIDLFESLKSNEKFSNNTSSSLDYKHPPAVLSKSFILPFKINSMAISKTRFGVTTKSIIISLTNGQILYLPKYILNSRRVQDRPLTNEEKSEFMLTPYDPIITIDDNFVISHHRQVMGADTLISVPTNLESTSIVCSYGLDVFCTRVSPSLQFDKLTSGFDKVKLIASILMLIIIVLILKPLKDSRNLKSLWVIES
ncbi:hypothetical protein WICANDRAFT_77914 [Wickerhamomyces anomalus NRRL Y-366-8]|uniref:ER membrane protein complex subunit 1 n=1 Tax=Wickerhamomyces anomalus (strain ATCC 58044 / CBS 1984 / NCYC 433 / NRRL Y-366-8) TaxID=683960 RepID=A0A1E3P775_WICAA|nr:uncharacterized protein WICANDRAFT_77914 [Wickerhamomyces anomalus NRRL Y-366-8]ODQ61275.1 hypothetical protein WICANDRAFT_77914 [Wickerhamomyces anomalus NRRL Y-366-8]